ncbi:MAG TPA: lipocalin-like domain-containing protein [Casimicrobiaceae bacterium]|nr:lipocalin-like domain-containing protein [Casimicrobiaceae bacterium]
MKRRAFFLAPLLLLGPRARAADPFPEVTPGHALQFPQDFGSHAAFRNEWWYITGWLEDASHNASGFQITFFRNRPGIADESSSAFAPRQLLFAHAAIADPRLGHLRHDERAAREGFGLAAAREETTDVWIGDWSLRRVEDGYRAQIAAHDFGFDLHFTPTQAVLPEGEAGVSRKGPLAAQASYYYSEPHLAVKGRAAVASADVPVTGVAWLDHEWSSEYMAPQAVGWDWTGINFDDGSALMAFRMRDRAGARFWAGGSHRAADGRVRAFHPDEIDFTPSRRWRSPRTQVEYPVAMTVRAGDLRYSLEPLIDDQELDARTGVGVLYWEGAVRATAAGPSVGRGYLELTGYGKPLKL